MSETATPTATPEEVARFTDAALMNFDQDVRQIQGNMRSNLGKWLVWSQSRDIRADSCKERATQGASYVSLTTVSH